MIVLWIFLQDEDFSSLTTSEPAAENEADTLETDNKVAGYCTMWLLIVWLRDRLQVNAVHKHAVWCERYLVLVLSQVTLSMDDSIFFCF